MLCLSPNLKIHPPRHRAVIPDAPRHHRAHASQFDSHLEAQRGRLQAEVARRVDAFRGDVAGFASRWVVRGYLREVTCLSGLVSVVLEAVARSARPQSCPSSQQPTRLHDPPPPNLIQVAGAAAARRAGRQPSGRAGAAGGRVGAASGNAGGGGPPRPGARPASPADKGSHSSAAA